MSLAPSTGQLMQLAMCSSNKWGWNATEIPAAMRGSVPVYRPEVQL